MQKNRLLALYANKKVVTPLHLILQPCLPLLFFFLSSLLLESMEADALAINMIAIL